MSRLRTASIACAAALLTAGALALPADAASRRGGGPGGQGGPGGGGPGASTLALTAAATATLDRYDADLDAINGAWTRRSDDDRILVALRGSRGSGTSAGFELATDSASTSWTAFKVDRTTGAVTATVDGTAGVQVFTSTATSTTKRSARTLLLTEASATALDTLLGADEFDAGDTFGTLGK